MLMPILRVVRRVTVGPPGAFKMRRPALAEMLLIAHHCANDKICWS
jgi:hypothetical protein